LLSKNRVRQLDVFLRRVPMSLSEMAGG
jgi:hypothetical protein